MPFIALLVASLICVLLALKLHMWQFGLMAVLLAIPIALVANVSYGLLLLFPSVLLAVTVALRWSVGRLGWVCLILAAIGIWFVGAASPLLLHWPTLAYWVLLLAMLSGLVALFWSHVPWGDRQAPSST